MIRASYYYLHFDEDGNLDQVRYEDDIHVTVEASLPEFLSDDSDGNVVYASQKFSKKKRDSSIWWKPNSKLECEIFDVAIERIKCKSL